MFVRFGSVFHVMEINWKEESLTWTLILCHVQMSVGFKFWWQCKMQWLCVRAVCSVDHCFLNQITSFLKYFHACIRWILVSWYTIEITSSNEMLPLHKFFERFEDKISLLVMLLSIMCVLFSSWDWPYWALWVQILKSHLRCYKLYRLNNLLSLY